MTRIVKIEGMDVDLDRIQNHKLRRVVRENQGFMFNYSDKKYEEYRDSKYGDTNGPDYSDTSTQKPTAILLDN